MDDILFIRRTQESMNKDERISAKTLFERGVIFFDRGNFKEAKRIFKDVIATNPNEDLKNKASEMIKKLSLDRVELTIGLLSLLFLAFLYSYFGFLR